MLSMSSNSLRLFLQTNDIRQVDLARDLSTDRSQVNRWLADDANLTQRTIDALLEYLSVRLDRPVGYREVFRAERVAA